MAPRPPIRRLALAAVTFSLCAGCAVAPTGGGLPYGSDGKADGWDEPSADAAGSCMRSMPSPCLDGTPVAVETGLSGWVDELEEVGEGTAWERPLGVTECRWVHEIQGAVLCGSYELTSMNRFLARATMYIEGMVVGHRGEVIATDDPLIEEAAWQIGGHDLQSQDLVLFYDAVEEACAVDSRMCLTDHERAMRDLLMGIARDYGAFVVIAFAVRSPLVAEEVVAHEGLHAQYFLYPAYRETVDRYWAGLEDEEREPILQILGWSYDPEDDLLMRNEFQAYVLMAGAERQVLGTFVEVHRAPLTEALRQVGTPPIQVEQRSSRW